jgi:hypothetical protein
MYEIRVTKSIQISRAEQRLHAHRARLRQRRHCLGLRVGQDCRRPARLRKEEAAASAVQQEIRRQIGTT